MRPVGGSRERRRNGQELDADEISDRFIRTGNSTHMSDAGVDGDVVTLQFQVQRLDGLRRHRHRRGNQRSIPADVHDARGLGQLERRPQGANDFEPNARSDDRPAPSPTASVRDRRSCSCPSARRARRRAHRERYHRRPNPRCSTRNTDQDRLRSGQSVDHRAQPVSDALRVLRGRVVHQQSNLAFRQHSGEIRRPHLSPHPSDPSLGRARREHGVAYQQHDRGDRSAALDGLRADRSITSWKPRGAPDRRSRPGHGAEGRRPCDKHARRGARHVMVPRRERQALAAPRRWS